MFAGTLWSLLAPRGFRLSNKENKRKRVWLAHCILARPGGFHARLVLRCGGQAGRADGSHDDNHHHAVGRSRRHLVASQVTTRGTSLNRPVFTGRRVPPTCARFSSERGARSARTSNHGFPWCSPCCPAFNCFLYLRRERPVLRSAAVIGSGSENRTLPCFQVFPLKKRQTPPVGN